MASLRIVPITIGDASAYVAQHHRHHKAVPPGHALWSLAVESDGRLVGVAIVGRPKARHLQDGATAEVVRLATDGTPNACSMLYGAAWRAARALGFRRLVTYILISEPGTTLRAAGWTLIGEAGGGRWSRPARPRDDQHPTQRKLRFEVVNG